MSTETPFVLSERRRITLPGALLATLIIACAVAYARITSVENRIGDHTKQISDIEADARTTREILIRIDENVKDLRRDTRRNAP